MQFAQPTDGTNVSGQSQLFGLRSYASAPEAVFRENSNDPVHILYPDIIRENAELFLNGFNGKSLYAIKSNPHLSVLNALWTYGVRDFEVASLREIEFMKAQFPEANLYFMHPVKSRQAIRFAYAQGVRTFAFDCLEELQKIEEETDFALDLNLFLRVDVAQEKANYPLTGKFGASSSEMPLLLQRASKIANKLGVTFHVGSQCMDPGAYVEAISSISAVLEQAALKVDMLDVGGGFPVQYPDQTPVHLGAYFKTIEAAVNSSVFEGVELLCEPGRALIANAGSVAVRVELRKANALYLNDGTYGSLFDAGVPSWSYAVDVIKANEVKTSSELAEFKLYGPTCDSLDVLTKKFTLPENVQEGDWILFHHLGAYGYAMQTKFNGFHSETTVAVCPGK